MHDSETQRPDALRLQDGSHTALWARGPELPVCVLAASGAVRASSDQLGLLPSWGSFFLIKNPHKRIKRVLGNVRSWWSSWGKKWSLQAQRGESAVRHAGQSPSCHPQNHLHWVGALSSKPAPKTGPVGICTRQVPCPALGLSSIHTALSKNSVALRNPCRSSYA